VTVIAALRDMARHPVEFLRTRWNWKAALASLCLRGALFFGATLQFGVPVATRALLVDATFRLPVAGTCAGVIQAVRGAEPTWAALTVAVIGVPAVAHLIETAAHTAGGTPMWWRGVALSMALSAVSSAFEWSLMRHGILLVGAGADSLGGDLAHLVRLLRRGLS